MYDKSFSCCPYKKRYESGNDEEQAIYFNPLNSAGRKTTVYRGIADMWDGGTMHFWRINNMSP